MEDDMLASWQDLAAREDSLCNKDFLLSWFFNLSIFLYFIVAYIKYTTNCLDSLCNKDLLVGWFINLGT